MKTAGLMVLFLLLIFSCKRNTVGVPTSTDKISALTDKFTYSAKDTIHLVVSNKTEKDISLFYRCGKFLEMYYQKRTDKNHWSDTLMFDYMTLRCPTFERILAHGQVTESSLGAYLFKTKGTFRLIIPYNIPEEAKGGTLTSNSFEIK